MESPLVYKKNSTVWLLLKGLYGLKRAGRIWDERFKADMEEFGFVQCPKDRAVFRVGTWRSDDWAACAFWVDDETGIGSCHQPERMPEMFSQKYGISGKGDMCWTLGRGVTRVYDAHITGGIYQRPIRAL